MDKGLRNLVIEIVVATVVTIFLAERRHYGSLFMQVLPVLYILVLFEITTRYAYLHKSSSP